MKEIRRILIYRIGNLGDIVCAIPAMVAIRQHFSEAKISLLTNKESTGNPDAEEILKGNNFLDEIITYDPSRLREFRYALDILKKLRSLGADLLVYLSISESSRRRILRDWLFFRLSGCKRSIGFKLPKAVGTYMVHGIKLPLFPQEVDRLISLLAPFGIKHDTKKIDFQLPIKENDKKVVGTIWDEYRLKGKNPIVAICPGGKFPVKHWSVEKYASVSSILQKDFGVTILLIGGLGEKVAGEMIKKTAGNSIVNLIGKTTYMESAEVISRCNLLISNDCGAAHLAAAVGTPVVGIYSSRNFPGAWHPWGNHHTVLRNDTLPCHFCFRTECETKECINSIAVEQVIEACSKYLE